MHELRRRILLNFIRVADLAVMGLAFGVALLIAGQSSRQAASLNEFLAVRITLLNFLFFVGWLIVWHVLFRSFGLYRTRRAGVIATEWWGVTKAAAVGSLLLSFVGMMLHFEVVTPAFLISFFFFVVPGTIIVRFCLRSFFAESNRNGGIRRLVIVGCGPRGTEFGKRVRNRPDFGYLLLGYVDDMPPPENPLHGGPEKILGPPDQMREILEANDVDEVVITLPIASHYHTASRVISMCEELAIDVLMPTDFFDSRLVNVAKEDSRAWPAMELRSSMPSTGGVVLKRVIDFFVSLFALVVLSPLLVLISIAIKLDSRGSIFFRQARVGLKRKVFNMHKFRTMYPDAEERIKELESLNEVEGAAFKMTNDPRITRVGRTLRRLSLDELPQFFDVLRGKMSLVGPRPLPIRDVERFEKSWQKRRFSVKPGLTCLWQVSGRHQVEFENWMELDLEYIDSWSLSLDFDILMKTVPAVFKGTGAS